MTMKQSCFIFLVTIFSGIATATAQPFVPYHVCEGGQGMEVRGDRGGI